ncbi:MAG: helix-turn-helix domain-containing protein [Coriobacteriales bacterium]
METTKHEKDDALRIDVDAFSLVDPSGFYTKCLEAYPGLFLTTAQVAEFLQVTRQEVASMCRMGAFPNMPLRHCDAAHWRVPKLSLLMYLNGMDKLPESPKEA